MEIISKQEVEVAGLKRYFTGLPCKNGHIAARYVRSDVCVECEKAKQARSRSAHPERESARFARWATPEKERVRRKKWRSANPGKRKADQHKRRARRRNSVGIHTADDVLAIIKAQRGKCAWCRTSLRKAPPSVDHIVPLSRGGSNYRQNIQVLCMPCNSRKGGKDPIEFARQHHRLL